MRSHIFWCLALFMVLVSVVDVHAADDCGFFASLFDNCPTSSAPPAASSGPSQAPSSASSKQPVPTSESVTGKPSSAPSAQPSGHESKPASATHGTASATDAEPSDSLSPTESSGQDEHQSDSGSNTTAIIAGSVCGGVVVLGAAVGLIVLSRKRRQRKLFRKDIQHDFQPLDNDTYSALPTPAVTANHLQQDQHQAWNTYHDPADAYGYGAYPAPLHAPASPMVGHDPYYASQSMVNVAPPQGAYYPDTYGHYTAYNAPPPQDTAAHMAWNQGTMAEPIYSAPNAYDNDPPRTTDNAKNSPSSPNQNKAT